jgi:hypothetical protein
MATKRVSLTLDKAALSAAERAAAARGVSLSVWLSRAAWDCAIQQAARVSAEQDRARPGEFTDWDSEQTAHVLGDAA